ncbi:MFS transporter [Actinomadura namibiensis]|uniref:EmrB/QacA subfamily drug resistance transporter n=1 Tax=Actinomadura namibiensis TaxID=182080 RepID=A0A7W3LTH8_ACTNM|nr:EmrB/QacA subfamily drug resistance transporter [Actinomadura namibiensis]
MAQPSVVTGGKPGGTGGPGPAAPAVHYTHRQILEILSGLMMAMLTAMISTSVVGTALPTIVGDLGGQDQLSWVAAATMLTMTASTPLWGKLSDIFGRKLMFQSALLIFVLASVGAGLSQNMGELIAARAVQGLGVGGLSALAQVILGDVVPPRERGRYSGYMGAVFGVATVAGPLLGGFIVDADGLGWRWCFYVCIPLAVVAFAVIQKVLKLPKIKRNTSLDLFGAFTITGAAALLMLVLTLGDKEFEWNSPWTYGLSAGAVVLLALSVLAERLAKDPILPPRLFRNPTFVLTSIASLLVGVVLFGSMIYLPQYLQIVKGMSPTASGLMTLPMVLGMFVTSTVSGQLVTRTGRWKIYPVVGLLFVAGAMYLLSQLHVDSSRTVIGVDVAVLGFGLGLVMQILILAAQNSADLTDLAAITSGVSFFRNLGSAIGVAAFGAILNNRLKDEVAEGMAAAHIRPQGDGELSLGTPEAIHDLPEPLKGIILNGFTSALETVFMVGIPVAVAAFLVMLFVKELPLRGARAAADGPAPAGRHSRGAEPRPATATATAPAAVASVPAGPPATPQGGAPISGRVTSGDGTPVAGAALTLIDVGGHQLGRALTREDGGYTLATPGPGTYVLIAATGEHEPQAATLVVGDRPVDFDLLLAGNGGLAGVVHAPGGAPIEGAMVVVTDVRGEVVGTVRTGSDGTYLVKDVTAGAYTLAVSAPAFRPAALPVEIPGNGQLRQDVELPPGAKVRGVIRNRAGQAVADARVTLIDAAGNVVAATVTGPDGEYAFGDLTGGQYTVTATGYPPVAAALSLTDGDSDGNDLVLGHPDE